MPKDTTSFFCLQSLNVLIVKEKLTGQADRLKIAKYLKNSNGVIDLKIRLVAILSESLMKIGLVNFRNCVHKICQQK